MTIHIDYDREENKIESILASQSNVIRILGVFSQLFNLLAQHTPNPEAHEPTLDPPLLLHSSLKIIQCSKYKQG